MAYVKGDFDLMTANEFRQLALGISGAIESAHMNHPDFRIKGKVFATLAYPDENWGMVKLTLEQQRSFIEQAPNVFRPCKGAWGQRGATNVHLASANKALLQAALQAAASNLIAQKKSKKG
jgi:hypothetical protein